MNTTILSCAVGNSKKNLKLKKINKKEEEEETTKWESPKTFISSRLIKPIMSYPHCGK